MRKICYLFISMCMIFSLSSCSLYHKYSIKEITDIKDEYPISIVVTFNDEYEGSCEITDETLIRQIIELLNAREYKFSTASPPPGTNRSLMLKYSSGIELNISTRIIKENNGFYTPNSQDNLDYIIQEYAIEAGTITPR